jgi:hypothetical protein
METHERLGLQVRGYLKNRICVCKCIGLKSAVCPSNLRFAVTDFVDRHYLVSVYNVDTLWTDYLETCIFVTFR